MVCREHTAQLTNRRLDLPPEPPYTLEHNLWVANAPGSTLFMPVGDASEELLGLLTLLVGSGYLIFDDRAQRSAGNLDPFVRSGLLDEEKIFP